MEDSSTVIFTLCTTGRQVKQLLITSRGLTRERLIEALYELFADGNLTPTWQVPASKTGLTTRAIYDHFPDLDAVAVALAEEQMRRHAP